jgi:hypothetical protein
MGTCYECVYWFILNDPMKATANGKRRNVCVFVVLMALSLHRFDTFSFHSPHVRNREPHECCPRTCR